MITLDQDKFVEVIRKLLAKTTYRLEVYPRCKGAGWSDNYSAMIVDTDDCQRCKG